jgi:AmmeMemoRadiSam system protein B
VRVVRPKHYTLSRGQARSGHAVGSSHNHASTRPPAVAGLFYPHDAAELRSTVSDLLAHTRAIDLPPETRAFIVPHAGYVYSGAIAAAVYAFVATQRERIRRVVLIGPSHRVYLRGIAIAQAETFETPLGAIPVDQEFKAIVLERGDVIESDAPHAMEHSLEVQLPFLQSILADFTLVPLVAGSAEAQYVANVLSRIWLDEQTLLLVSSDLSHYENYATARELDAATAAAILARKPNLSGAQACGAVPINGLLQLARERDLMLAEIARCNSGDTAGDHDRVVGYGAFAAHGAQLSASA